MEEYLEVMRRTVELAETCMDGLHHIHIRLNEGLMEDTLYLLEDIVCGFCQITDSIQVLEFFFLDNEPLDMTTKVEMALHDILSAYEHHDINLASYSLSSLLLPSFQSWNNGIMRTFHPHILS
ncbi:hypothetical protein [Paenibacillus glacialis]|uniref:DUF8042 domain-containing protein n=1 Tax=Paenibacillus glacialis TaxID=494026 RepID=A0A168L696_9BACL|nr:hypothetical protein [Paenibacillus glacialis]OAB42939.1 hypothetical protein PGLA_10815 [Paenibacillus glacialis]